MKSDAILKVFSLRNMIGEVKDVERINHFTFRRYWVNKLPFVEPTLPPKPGPVMGISGL